MKENIHTFKGFFEFLRIVANSVGGKADDVSVIMLAGKASDSLVIDDGGANSFETISLHGNSDGRAAEKNAERIWIFEDTFRNFYGVIVIIVVFIIFGRAEVNKIREDFKEFLF